MDVPLSITWKSPTLDKYNDMINPGEHMDAYVTQVILYTPKYALLCQVLSTSLKRDTLSWFTRRPTQSIDCFDTLVTKFEV